jgi:phospholipid/cholesterol/gamma-HCH transport system permease protein
MNFTALFTQLIESFGSYVIRTYNSILPSIQNFGYFILFIGQSLRQIVGEKIRWNLMMFQMRSIGVSSMFIVMLTGLFTGMVMALQTGRAFQLFQAETLTGAVCALSISKELGPVLASLMITARSGSSMAAQLGTMQVTQQVDALTSMAINPMGYLVAPRIFACIVVTPILCALFIFIAMIGSYLVGVHLLHINQALFIEKIITYTDTSNIIEGMFKSAVFGFILASISCYKGFFTRGGAEGVGRSTTEAVVLSSVSILVFDYFLTALLF